MGLKVSSLGERGLQNGWHSFSNAAPKFKKNASEAYIWKKISGIWFAHILARPAFACRQLPNQESNKWRVSPDRWSKFFRTWCSLSWNWPINCNTGGVKVISFETCAVWQLAILLKMQQYSNIKLKSICSPGGCWPLGPLSPGHWSGRGSGSSHVPPLHLGFLISRRYSKLLPVGSSGTVNH